MDVLTFLVQLSTALAWPTVTLIVAITFRPHLVDLLRSLKKGKFGPAELEFERGIQALDAAAVEVPAVPIPTSTLKEAALHPRAAVLESWLRLEETTIDVALRKDLIKPTARRHGRGAVESLKRSKLLSDDHVQMLDDLQDLRNQAAHDPDFSPDPATVIAYIRLAEGLRMEIKELIKMEGS
ncbi:hypothetical protein [Stenotrophomonas maltophilia]|uniref:hypothetical protein n=1 Tax=Stenotrophomonas maltophilia TaxID=40324 RepID=UPI001F5354CB|nr:hypothetical protein [Stenotrophomonas maltophilia]MCI1124295.1 hypothetical protein [Stenotrophomonas maltophilia]